MNIHVKWRRVNESFNAQTTLTTFIPQKELGDPTPATRAKTEQSVKDFLYGDAHQVYPELRAYILARVRAGEDNYALDLLNRLLKAINPTFSHELTDELPQSPPPDKGEDWHNQELRKLIDSNSRMFWHALTTHLTQYAPVFSVFENAGITPGEIALRFLVINLTNDTKLDRAVMQEFMVCALMDTKLQPHLDTLIQEFNKLHPSPSE